MLSNLEYLVISGQPRLTPGSLFVFIAINPACDMSDMNDSANCSAVPANSALSVPRSEKGADTLIKHRHTGPDLVQIKFADEINY